MQNYKFYYFLLSFLISLLFLLKYEYNYFYFLCLSIVCNGYFIFSFSKNAQLFHLFNSFFLWMGFWFKIVIVNIFFNNQFLELNTDAFNYLIFYDQSIVVSIIGIAGFFCSLILNLLFLPFKYPQKKTSSQIIATNFFNNYKNYVLILFLIAVLIINYFNFNYFIYQKGIESNENINSLILVIFKWLLLFGLASFSSLIIYHSILKQTLSIRVLLVVLFENFITSISLLSRGMFINFMGIIFGVFKYNQYLKINNLKKNILFIFNLFIILFLISLYFVTDLRSKKYFEIDSSVDKSIVQKENIYDKSKAQGREIFRLIAHRFVGFESVLAISSFKNKNFDFLKSSFSTISDSNKSFSDVIKNENFNENQSTKEHTYFIKVPGIIAFLYYSGSLLFVFIVCFFLGIMLTYFEKFIVRFSNGNLIFAALISQTLAYRLSSFGHMPQNTYLLIITILFNLLIIYLFYFFLIKSKQYNEH